MDELCSGEHLLLLNKLLNPEKESDSDEDDNVSGKKTVSSLTPATIAGVSMKEGKDIIRPLRKENLPKNLEEWEAQEELEIEELDTRKIPRYSITYKQEVKVEDVFLQMSNKTSATSSCEDMILTIDLPEEDCEVDRMELKTTEVEVDLQTQNYRLKLPLPHPIDPDRKKASWDAEKRQMILTMRMRRELDFVNF
ncbi:Dynein axonemal assembly factor 6 [Sergentomyia squamirostris]